MKMVQSLHAMQNGRINMVEITQRFYGANICIWRNIQSYYFDNMEIISEESINNDDAHSGYHLVKVKVKSKADWACKMSAGNR